MAEFLLHRGAMPTLPDDAHWATPIALARYPGRDEIVILLTAHLSM